MTLETVVKMMTLMKKKLLCIYISTNNIVLFNAISMPIWLIFN